MPCFLGETDSSLVHVVFWYVLNIPWLDVFLVNSVLHVSNNVCVSVRECLFSVKISSMCCLCYVLNIHLWLAV